MQDVMNFVNWISEPDAIMNIIFGVITTILAYYAIQGERKAILCEVIKEPLLRSDAYHSDNIQISSEGEVIENPYFLFVTIRNNGRKPIGSEDIQAPFKIASTRRSRSSTNHFISAAVTESEPIRLQEDISLKIDVDEQYVELDKFVMNPGSFVTVRVLGSHLSDNEDFAVSAIIKGVSNITQVEPDESVNFNPISLMQGIVLGIILTGLVTILADIIIPYFT